MNIALSYACWRFSSMRAEFYQDLAEALSDNAVLVDYLAKLEQRERTRHGSFMSMTPLYVHWLERLKRMGFARALEDTVPATDAMVLAAAEDGGRLVEGLLFLSQSIQNDAAMKGAYIGALISPGFAFLMIIMYLWMYATQNIPALAETIPVDQWTGVNRLLYVVSTGMLEHGGKLIILLCVLVWLLLWSFPRWVSPIRFHLEHWPTPWNMYRDAQSVRFLVALATLLQSNVNLKDALIRLRDRSSPWQGWHISVMLRRLEKQAAAPGKALDSGLFSQRLMDRIEDYAERSSFNLALKNIAIKNADKILAAAKRNAMILNYVALVSMAAVMGLLIISSVEMNQMMQSAAFRSN